MIVFEVEVAEEHRVGASKPGGGNSLTPDLIEAKLIAECCTTVRRSQPLHSSCS